MKIHKKLPNLFCSLFALIFTQCAQSEIIDNDAFKIVTKFNKKCPMMIDSETKIDGIEVKKPKTILYKYTLVNVSIENVDTALFNITLRPGIINTVKINPDLQDLKTLKANFEYSYKDKKNKFIYSFTITPKEYEVK